MDKAYYIAKQSKTGNIWIVLEREKVSETIFNDVLDSKIKEVLGEEADEKFEEAKASVLQTLSKMSVGVSDRNFTIKKIKSKSIK